jgi:hypothetical protein
MIPGSQSKLSESVVVAATTVTVKSDLVRFTGATQIETILSPLQGSSMILFVVSTSGALVLGTAGNILVGQTLAVNRLYMLIWSRAAAKWYIHGVV